MMDCTDVVLHVQPSSGETITDRSGDNNVITLVGDTTVDNSATLFGGDTINFDGAGDYLKVGDNTTYSYLHDGTTDYTVECWVNFSTISSGANPIIGTAGNSGTVGFSLYYAGISNNNNEWRAIIWRGSLNVAVARVDIPGVPETNRWYHVAAVHTNNTFYFYIDGVLGGSDSGSNYSTSSSFRELRIGAFEAGSGIFIYSDCQIQDIRISKKAVYTSNFTPPTSLLPLCVTRSSTTTVIDTGSGYTSPGTDVPTTGGSGTGLKDPTITDDGTGYQDGDVVDIPGGTEPAKVVITTYTQPPAGTDTDSILYKIGRSIKTSESLSLSAISGASISEIDGGTYQ
jgi:hypothetical protein